jgi:hypothetical protein
MAHRARGSPQCGLVSRADPHPIAPLVSCPKASRHRPFSTRRSIIDVTPNLALYSELGRPDHSKTLSYNGVGFMLDPSSCAGEGRARGSTSISAVTTMRAVNEQPIRAFPSQCSRVFRSTVPTTAAAPGMSATGARTGEHTDSSTGCHGQPGTRERQGAKS